MHVWVKNQPGGESLTLGNEAPPKSPLTPPLPISQLGLGPRKYWAPEKSNEVKPAGSAGWRVGWGVSVVGVKNEEQCRTRQQMR